MVMNEVQMNESLGANKGDSYGAWALYAEWERTAQQDWDWGKQKETSENPGQRAS